MAFKFIDYSQYRAFQTCPWYWFEKYITELVPRREAYQRDDAAAIGSLVHSGLEQWAKTREPKIAAAVIDEIGPTPEAFGLAEGMVHEYVRRYPEEAWEFLRTEEPLKFPLPGTDIPGLAKIDKYFFVPEQTTVETGIEGSTFDLSPGWWIHEYKTKDAQISRAHWNMQWEANRQADFQILALREKVGTDVQGIIVQVLEKPRLYIPKRKCKGCATTLEMPSWLPAEDGKSACPMCGNKQVLEPVKEKAPRPLAEFYRTVVTLTAERLDRAAEEIACTSRAMANMIKWGIQVQRPTREACVFPAMRRVCDYFKPHTYDAPLEEGALWERREATKYVGLEELVAV